jgi:hypothetical protein
VGKGGGAGRDGGVDVLGDDSSPDMADGEQHRRHGLARKGLGLGCHLRVRRSVAEQHPAAEALDPRSPLLQKRPDFRPRAAQGYPKTQFSSSLFIISSTLNSMPLNSFREPDFVAFLRFWYSCKC